MNSRRLPSGSRKYRLLDRAVPDEAQVAVPGPDAIARHGLGVHARPVHVELLGAEAIRPARPALDQLGADHIAVERVRALQVRDRDDAVVERDHTEIPYASVNASCA